MSASDQASAPRVYPPRTAAWPWRAWLLIAGILLLLMAAVNWSFRLNGRWLWLTYGMAGVGAAASLVGVMLLLTQRRRSARGLEIHPGRGRAYALPAIIAAFILAGIVALLPLPVRYDWMGNVFPALLVGVALWLGWGYIRNAAPLAYEQAQQAHKQGQDDMALALLRTLEQERPDFIGTYYLQAAIYRQRQDYADAHEASQRLIALRPDLYYGHAEHGLAFLAEGRPDEALAPLQRATQVAPDLPEGHFNLGMAYIEAREYAQAITALSRALRLGLRDSIAELIARYQLAVAFKALGNDQQARRELHWLRRHGRILDRWRSELSEGSLALAERRKEHALVSAIEHAIKGSSPIKG